MPRISLFSILLLLILTACSNDDDGDDRGEYQFYGNATIMVNEFDFAVVETGQNLVFEYSFTAEDDPQIADDEYSERIIFEVDANAEEFSFTDTALSTANTYFDKYCFCFIEGSIPIGLGSISGDKVDDNTWRVTIDVTFDDSGEQSRTVSGLFRLTSR